MLDCIPAHRHINEAEKYRVKDHTGEVGSKGKKVKLSLCFN
jgi:hypothetical protein